MKNIQASFTLFTFVVLLIASCSQEEQEAVTLEDYKRAEQFLSANATPLVHGVVSI